jgi:hypothetical protein
MKKYLLILTCLLATSLTLSAQDPLYSFDFEAETPYIGIVQQYGSPWATWSGASGGSEDVIVSNAFAYSGKQSLNCKKDNDVILDLNDITTGRYKISFYMFVKQESVAYFNLLIDFNGQNSNWATETFFNKDGSAITNADGTDAGSFFYVHQEWYKVEFIIDLDDDFATMIFNNKQIANWKWSKGATGNSNRIKLDALNFYGWTDRNGTASDFFIDDIVISEITAPGEPIELTTNVVNNDVELNWTEPSTTPTSYAISKNGRVFKTGIESNEFTDEKLYPNKFEYQVRAFYDDLGYSHGSNVAIADIPGGIKRNQVLFEIFTGTWCGYCPGAARGADDLHEGEYNTAIIEYHNGDKYSFPDCQVREEYYTVSAFPTTTVDGLNGFSGGSATESLINSYLTLFEEREVVPSIHQMDIEIDESGSGQFTANITVEQLNSYFSDGLILRSVLTESHISEIWGNGLTEVNFVCRKLFPNANGYPLDFSAGNTATYSFDFSLSEYVANNCELVCFIQHDPTKEVVQTAKVDFGLSSINQPFSNTYIEVYPNPTNGRFSLDINSATPKDISIRIMTVTGELLQEYNLRNSLMSSRSFDLSAYSSGVYFIQINDGMNTTVKKITLID